MKYYDRSRKKRRGYRRECRRLLRRVEQMQPRFRPDAYCHYETLSLHANLFHKPKGKDRRELLAALLYKTEAIAAQMPREVSFCRVVLAVYENNFACSDVLIFYDAREYADFWNRNNPLYQKWTRIDAPSLAASMNIQTSLTECCYREEVCNEEEHFYRRIWFYENDKNDKNTQEGTEHSL